MQPLHQDILLAKMNAGHEINLEAYAVKGKLKVEKFCSLGNKRPVSPKISEVIKKLCELISLGRKFRNIPVSF